MYALDTSRHIDAVSLAQFIPHSGPMVLLDRVVTWDENSIVCLAKSHKDPANPLRLNGCLSSVQTIEYTAQAVSLHAALMCIYTQKPIDGLAEAKAIETGFLAVVRDFELLDVCLDDFDDEFLELSAQMSSMGPRMIQYHVQSRLGGTTISKGLISLVVKD
jgi:predicted hotdog family 3-hydroxylacyl-ACP dehydratase